MLREAEERACQAQRRAAEAEALQRSAEQREAALLGRAEAAEARAAELERQLARARQGAGAADVWSLSQALSGETSTASFAELAAATGGFAASSILGRGGFGPVYRGEWGGQAVAIKRLDQTSQQGVRELLREVMVLGSYRHRHLVPLVCFSLSRQRGQQEACLVYPLMPGGGLDRALADRAARPLGAAARLRIAADAAAGLAYLHAPGGGLGPLLHRDVKSSNVLLDEGLRARVSDVGLARPQRGATMTAGVGTFGYIDPEYFETGDYTPASDVFSFGVVLLELLTGAAPVDPAQRPANLYARVRARLPDHADAVADPAAGWAALPGGGAVARNLGALAARCVVAAGSERPSFGEVLAELERLCGAPPADGGAEEGRGECVVCMAAPRGARLRPCFHALLCAPCAADLVRRGGTCPACRAAVERFEEGAFDATFAPA